MTWSYGDPGSSSLWAIRSLVGDTIATDPVLSDEEINFYIAQEGSTYYAAAAVVVAIVAKFSRGVQKSDGQITIMSNQRHAQYMKLIAELRARGRLNIQAPYVGGISQADHDSNEQSYGDTLVAPVFRKAMWPVAGGTPQTDITR